VGVRGGCFFRLFFSLFVLHSPRATSPPSLHFFIFSFFSFSFLQVTRIHDEEWSFIPVGGPLPVPDPARPLTAFGAAAGLVHPATGYSLARSLAEAPAFAASAAAALRGEPGRAGAAAVSAAVWASLWPAPRRRAAAFQLFGMELLARLGPADTDAFFRTFFSLPAPLWRGFLASTLSPAALIGFALATFAVAPWRLRFALVRHLATDPSGRYLIRAYATGAGGVSESE
jgi:lycopene epsilon-cyclase